MQPDDQRNNHECMQQLFLKETYKSSFLIPLIPMMNCLLGIEVEDYFHNAAVVGALN